MLNRTLDDYPCEETPPRLRLVDSRAPYDVGPANEHHDVSAEPTSAPIDIARRTDLSPWARLLYGVLREHVAAGVAPSVERLASELGASVATVRRAISELVAASLIERTPAVGRKPNGYAFPDNRRSPMSAQNDDSRSPANAYDENSRSPESTYSRRPSDLSAQNTNRRSPMSAQNDDLGGVRGGRTLTSSLLTNNVERDIDLSLAVFDDDPLVSSDDDPTHSADDGESPGKNGRSTPKPPKYPADFEAFWSAYPKGRGNKVKSGEQWKRWKPDNRLRDEIMAGLESWKACSQWQDLNYVMYAERWLRDRHWEDDPPNSEPTAKSKLPHNHPRSGQLVF